MNILFFPFIPTTIEVVVSVVSAAVILAVIFGPVKNIWRGKNEIKLCVLGMEATGKTIWLNYLQGKDYEENPPQTNEEYYPSFSLEFAGGRKVYISAGKDLGGNDDIFNEEYENCIKNNDSIMFFFNSNKYLNPKENLYKRRVHARLDFIFKKVTTQTVYIVMTHKDLNDLRNKNNKKVMFDILKTFDKKWVDRCKEHTLYVNMRSEEDREKMKKIFDTKD